MYEGKKPLLYGLLAMLVIQIGTELAIIGPIVSHQMRECGIRSIHVSVRIIDRSSGRVAAFLAWLHSGLFADPHMGVLDPIACIPYHALCLGCREMASMDES